MTRPTRSLICAAALPRAGALSGCWRIHRDVGECACDGWLARPRDGDGPPRRTATVEEAGSDRAEEATTIDALLDQLPPRDRVVVELRFRHELLQREIGELLGISQMQVSRILARSIATLHELADAPGGPAAAT
jgi:RNA polymerase sigma factor (sigma-70 family)